jgi:hypothetical protein
MNNIKNKLIIGVGGVARSGKNLFASILINQLSKRYNLMGQQFALANELKRECASFVHEKLNIDVYTENTEEKTKIRDFLVWYADIKRKETNGRYWVDLLDVNLKDIFARTPSIDVAIVTDIRYDHYEKDELHWIKNENNGLLVHVSKFSNGLQFDSSIDTPNLFPKLFTAPANSHEKLNDPKIKLKADYLLEWEDINYSTNLTYTQLLDNEYLNNSVIKCLEQLEKKHILLKS